MNHLKRIAYFLALVATLLGREAVADHDDVELADVPAVVRRVGGDVNQRYVLAKRKDEPVPEGGYGLLVVLPSGDGGLGFASFVRRILKDALPQGYLVAQPIAPKWTAKPKIVWPTAKLSEPEVEAKFTTEDFVAGVIDDVAAKEKIDPARVFVLAWSSSGTAAYTAALTNPKIRGAFVAMSVFKPELLPPLEGARDKAFYLYHSPEDAIPIAMAEQAAKDLEANGATVTLKTYAGGHGWRGDIFGDQRAGIEWLESKVKATAEQTKP